MISEELLCRSIDGKKKKKKKGEKSTVKLWLERIFPPVCMPQLYSVVWKKEI